MSLKSFVIFALCLFVADYAFIRHWPIQEDTADATLRVPCTSPSLREVMIEATCSHDVKLSTLLFDGWDMTPLNDHETEQEVPQPTERTVLEEIQDKPSLEPLLEAKLLSALDCCQRCFASSINFY